MKLILLFLLIPSTLQAFSGSWVKLENINKKCNDNLQIVDVFYNDRFERFTLNCKTNTWYKAIYKFKIKNGWFLQEGKKIWKILLIEKNHMIFMKTNYLPILYYKIGDVSNKRITNGK